MNHCYVDAGSAQSKPPIPFLGKLAAEGVPILVYGKPHEVDQARAALSSSASMGVREVVVYLREPEVGDLMAYKVMKACLLGRQGTIPMCCPNYVSVEARDFLPHNALPPVLCELWREHLAGGKPGPMAVVARDASIGAHLPRCLSHWADVLVAVVESAEPDDWAAQITRAVADPVPASCQPRLRKWVVEGLLDGLPSWTHQDEAALRQTYDRRDKEEEAREAARKAKAKEKARKEKERRKAEALAKAQAAAAGDAPLVPKKEEEELSPASEEET